MLSMIKPESMTRYGASGTGQVGLSQKGSHGQFFVDDGNVDELHDGGPRTLGNFYPSPQGHHNPHQDDFRRPNTAQVPLPNLSRVSAQH